MDERIIQFRVGVMVFATILITLILVFMFGDFNQIFHGTNEVRVWLREAPGVSVDTPVRKSGILVGRVTRVEFVDEDFGQEEVRRDLGIGEEEFQRGVVITMAIQKNKPIYRDEACRVGTSLLGDATIHIVRTNESIPGPYGYAGPTGPVGPDGDRSRIGGGEWMHGEIAVDPIQSVRDLAPKLEEVMDSIHGTSQTVGELANSFNRLLRNNEENLDRAFGRAGDALDAVEQLASNANRILGDEQTQLDIRRAIERLPVILDDTHKAVVQIQHSMGTFNRSLKNIEDFTEPLGRDAEKMIGRVESSLTKLDQLAGELVQFSQAMNNSEGTLGQLIHNPELYQNLNRTIRNVEYLTRKLEPIIDDARVFSDKVSRNPGIIVRDAVRPGPGLK
ncbi:MAG: hypothetical protein RBS80_08460 [Thermoguttaceae bacterium]|jgi:phospholipid/cholesterol/gamma-HCH transport system substrate-binding protein|nr:hypothetical protein [Thermoguttaceae bacterium]